MECAPRLWKRLADWTCVVCEGKYGDPEADQVARDIGFVDHMFRFHLPSFPHQQYSRSPTNLLELAWLCQASIGASEEDRKQHHQRQESGVAPIETKLIQTWARATHAFGVFSSLDEYTQMDRRLALELETQPDVPRLQEAAHLFGWFGYILARVGDVYSPPAVPFSADHALVVRARAMLHTKLTSVLPDLIYDLSRPLLNGMFQPIAALWRFERQNPEDIGFIVQSKVLQTNLDAFPNDRAEYLKQYNLDPRTETDQCTDRAREQWYLAIFAYGFDQAINRSGNTITFLSHYVIHWSDWGSIKAHKILTTPKRMGRRALPVLLHLGVQHWAIWDPFTTLTLYIVKDIVHALALWQYLVAQPLYSNRLENNREVPELGWGVRALVEAAQADEVPLVLEEEQEAEALIREAVADMKMDVDE